MRHDIARRRLRGADNARRDDRNCNEPTRSQRDDSRCAASSVTFVVIVMLRRCTGPAARVRRVLPGSSRRARRRTVVVHPRHIRHAGHGRVATAEHLNRKRDPGNGNGEPEPKKGSETALPGRPAHAPNICQVSP
jgi:hypothetical protein